MVFFKDFGKETKDLFTKNTAEGKTAPAQIGADGKPVVVDGKAVPKPGQFNEVMWKVESKLKPTAAKPVVVNPAADAEGISATVEYMCLNIEGVKGKMVVKSGECAKPTFSYECCGRKVEATTKSFKGIAGYELSFEDKQKTYSAVAKVTEKAAAVEAAVPVSEKIEVGASFSYGMGKEAGKNSWAVGARYGCFQTVFSFLATDAKKFNLGAYIPVPGVLLENKPVVTGFQVDFDRKENAFDVAAAVAAQVPFCPFGSSFKFKVNKSLAISISHFVECAGWKVATTFDVKEKKVGVVFNLE